LGKGHLIADRDMENINFYHLQISRMGAETCFAQNKKRQGRFDPAFLHNRGKYHFAHKLNPMVYLTY